MLSFTGAADLTMCFDQVFMQGFYRKIMFLMECDRVIELCWAMGEETHMQMVFLALKCGTTELSSFK